MQKIKIGHRANFGAKYKCFPQILFPVRTILRSINFRCTDFITNSADACILVMACVDCARVHLKTIASLLSAHLKVAEHSFRARSCLRNSARAQVLHKKKPGINTAIILFAQRPRYLYYFASKMNTMY